VSILSLIACQQPSTKTDTTKEVSLPTMIGQMIMVGTRGMTIEEVSPAFQQQIQEGKIGGIILFDYDVVKKKAHRNIQSPEQVKNLIADLTKLAPTPLFIK